MESTLQESVYSTIKDRLTSGYWKPGTKLSETKLASELKVNRNPVREALLKLGSEGLINRSPNIGSTVALVTPETLIHIYQLREALEICAVRITAKIIQPVELLKLEHQNNIFKHFLYEGDQELAAENDNKFHKMFLELSENPILMEVWNQQRMRIIFMQNSLLKQNQFEELPKHDPDIAVKAHEKIIDALRQGDPDQAEIVIRAHLSLPYSELQELNAKKK